MSEEKTKTEQLRERIMLSENKGVKALAADEKQRLRALPSTTPRRNTRRVTRFILLTAARRSRLP